MLIITDYGIPLVGTGKLGIWCGCCRDVISFRTVPSLLWRWFKCHIEPLDILLLGEIVGRRGHSSHRVPLTNMREDAVT